MNVTYVQLFESINVKSSKKIKLESLPFVYLKCACPVYCFKISRTLKARHKARLGTYWKIKTDAIN